MYKSVRLWIRLAECCIQINHATSVRSASASSSMSGGPPVDDSSAVRFVGAEGVGKAALSPSTTHMNVVGAKASRSDSGHADVSDIESEATMQYALKCLQTAKVIVDAIKDIHANNEQRKSTKQATQVSSDVEVKKNGVQSAKGITDTISGVSGTNATKKTPTLSDSDDVDAIEAVCEKIVNLGLSFSPSLQAHIDGDSNSKAELSRMYEAIILKMAYVSLCVGDYHQVTSLCDKLAASPSVDGLTSALCNLYTAESLVMLRRMDEAKRYLSREVVEQGFTSIPPAATGKARENGEDDAAGAKYMSPYSTGTMSYEWTKAITLANMCAVRTLAGDLNQAKQILKKVNAALADARQRQSASIHEGTPSSYKAHMVRHHLHTERSVHLLEVYIYLACNDEQQALALLRQHRMAHTGMPLFSPSEC